MIFWSPSWYSRCWRDMCFCNYPVTPGAITVSELSLVTVVFSTEYVVPVSTRKSTGLFPTINCIWCSCGDIVIGQEMSKGALGFLICHQTPLTFLAFPNKGFHTYFSICISGTPFSSGPSLFSSHIDWCLVGLFFFFSLGVPLLPLVSSPSF